MHITDKEKKAIYEAMKQIRENSRLQEARTASGPLLPFNTQLARRGVKVYNPIPDTVGPFSGPPSLTAGRVGRAGQRPSQIMANPYTPAVAGGAVVAGSVVSNMNPEPPRGSLPLAPDTSIKRDKKLQEDEIEEQTGQARPAQSAVHAALGLKKRDAPTGPLDLNFNPYDKVPQISASPAADLRRTDAYKDKAGNIHIGAPVTSSDPKTGLTLFRTPDGELDAVTGTGRSTKEFDAGMRDTRRINVDQARMSRLKAAGLNLRDRMRGRPGRADMIGD